MHENGFGDIFDIFGQFGQFWLILNSFGHFKMFNHIFWHSLDLVSDIANKIIKQFIFSNAKV